MTLSLARLRTFSDVELLDEVKRLAACERDAMARLIASLAELDARRLYLGEGCSSLFTYCTQVLHLSEHAAYGRIAAARAAQRFPVLLELLQDGSLNLTAVGLLAPHLTAENHRDLLAEARHTSKREVEQIVARLRPQPDVAPTIRKRPPPRRPDPAPVPALTVDRPARSALTTTTAAAPAPEVARDHAAPTRPAVIPLAPERYKVQFTVSGEMQGKIRRAQDLLRHSVPNGDLAAVFERALDLLLDALTKRKVAAVPCPRPSRSGKPAGRHIPAAVKRAVWDRDGGQCAFVGSNGRCRETGLLEFHHLITYADGGQAVADNLELRC